MFSQWTIMGPGIRKQKKYKTSFLYKGIFIKSPNYLSWWMISYQCNNGIMNFFPLITDPYNVLYSVNYKRALNRSSYLLFLHCTTNK